MINPCKTCGSAERAANGACLPCKRTKDAAAAKARRARPKARATSIAAGLDRARGRKHLFVPDLQIRPGVPINHLYWIARYAADKNVDVVVLAGDVYDMPSLSAWDKRGSKSAEGRRVSEDLSAGDRGLEIFASVWREVGYEPDEMHVTKGNHEARRDRAIEESPHLLDGVVRDFAFRDYGWTEHEFLKPVTIDGIRYSHFFPHSASGAVVQTRRGAPSAKAQAQRQMCSATAGHQQGLDVAIHPTPDGLRRGLIAGSCYLHDEGYMGPLNDYWRGVILKHDVRNGNYNLCEVDLGFLAHKYGRFDPAGTVLA